MTLPKEIADLARESRSLALAETLASTMHGKTFHTEYHLLYDLRTLLGPDPKVYVEIGVYHGGSISFMMQHPHETELHGIDPLVLPNQKELISANLERFNTRGRKVMIHGAFSHDPSLQERLAGLRMDLLFIDGDHETASVIRDFELYAPRVNAGGFIVFDDYHDWEYSPGVRPAVDTIVDRLRAGAYPGRYEILGCLPNAWLTHPSDPTSNNEFILHKLA